MKVAVVILAGGEGSRIGGGKPLRVLGGKRLIEYHLERLAAGGFREVVVNTAWLGDMIEAALGTGRQYGLSITYSHERPEALETGGGIFNALPLLGSAPFLLVNGDVWADIDFGALRRSPPERSLAHLVLVPNPPQHPQGDFWLDARGRIHLDAPSRDEPHGAAGGAEANRYTYSTIGLFKSNAVASVQPGQRAALLPCFKAAVARGRLGGSLYRGFWADAGTPERWQALQAD